MTGENTDLSLFQDGYLDYLEGRRESPPIVEDLPEQIQPAARAFVVSIEAARGIDPYATRPSIEQLFSAQTSQSLRLEVLGKQIQAQLRRTVDSHAVVGSDVASIAANLASRLLVVSRGIRIRVVPETNSANLEASFTENVPVFREVFKFLPDTHAVLLTAIDEHRLSAIVDLGDVNGAIEVPTGLDKPPRMGQPVAGAGEACALWLNGLMPGFDASGVRPVTPASALDPVLEPMSLAQRVLNDVSAAGARARIQAKRSSWQEFGHEEASWLAEILEEARLGRLSERDYETRLDQIAEAAA